MIGAVIKDDCEGRKTVIPSDTSCHPQDDLCGADGRDICCLAGLDVDDVDSIDEAEALADIPGVVTEDSFACGIVDTADGAIGNGGEATVSEDVSEIGAGEGVNGGTSNAVERLWVIIALVDNGGVVGTA